MLKDLAEGEVVYTREEAAASLKPKKKLTNLPYIYLSAGVSANSSKKLLYLLMNQVQTSMVFFVDVLHGLDQLSLHQRRVKQQLMNGFRTTGLKTLMNSTKFFKQQRLHGKNVVSKSTLY